MHVEIEEYKQLLWQLEPSYKEDEDDPFEDLSQKQFATWGRVDVCSESQVFFWMYSFQSWVCLGSNSHFVIDLHVTLTFRHIWVVITFCFLVTQYYGTFYYYV